MSSPRSDEISIAINSGIDENTLPRPSSKRGSAWYGHSSNNGLASNMGGRTSVNFNTSDEGLPLLGKKSTEKNTSCCNKKTSCGCTPKEFTINTTSAVMAALIGAGPAFNALGAGTKTSPANYSIDWFMKLGHAAQVDAILSAVSAFGINALMGYRFNQEVVSKILKRLKDNKLLSAITIPFSAYGGLPAFAITLGGLMFAPAPVAYFLSIINFINTFNTRVVGLYDVGQSFLDIYNVDIMQQQQGINRLSRLKPEYQLKASTFLENKHLNHDTFVALIKQVDRWENDCKKANKDATIFEKEPSTKGQFITDNALGLSFFILSFVIFDQKGVDGLIALEKLIKNENYSKVALLNHLAQFGLGAISSIVNGIFYGRSAQKLRPVALETLNLMIEQFKHCPKDILKTAGFSVGSSVSVAANYYGGNAMRSVGQGIANNPNSVYEGVILPPGQQDDPNIPDGTTPELQPNDFQLGVKEAFPQVSATLGATVNAIYIFDSLNKVMKGNQYTENQLSPSLEQVISYEKNNRIDDKKDKTGIPLYKNALRGLSIFNDGSSLASQRISSIIGQDTSSPRMDVVATMV